MNIKKIRKKISQSSEKKTTSTSIERIEDLTPLNGYQPTRNKRQLQAHRSKAMFILFGGAVGGGKTGWLCNEAIFHCLKLPASRVFLARQHLSSFKRTTLLELLKWLPDGYIRQHNKSECFIEFKNKSRIYYSGLGDDIRAIEKLKSMELSAYGIDQAEEVSEEFFHMLNSRLRLTTVLEKYYQGWLTSNPSSNWVRQRFIESALENHTFIPSLPKDNPFLPSDYEQRLRETLPEELVQAWINGDWNVISDEQQLFTYEEIQDAMERKADKSGEPVYAVDVARYGLDESVIVKRQGNTVTIEKVFSKKSTMETSGKVIKEVGHDMSKEIRVDSIGIGAGVFDRLQEQHYNVREYLSSAAAKQNKIYKNLRAENYFNLKRLLPELSIPNDPKLRAQMMAIRYRVFSDGLLLIESKDEMRKRGLPSPDRLDAIVMVCSGSTKFLTKDEVKQKLESSKPFKGEHKHPIKRLRKVRGELEEEMRQFLGGNLRFKRSQEQFFSLEDMGIKSDFPLKDEEVE